jgi:hypothetical protein
MRASLIPRLAIIGIIAALACIGELQPAFPPSVAEVLWVRLEVEQPLHESELKIRVRDHRAANQHKKEVACQVYYVSESGKDLKEADFILKRASDGLYSGTYPTGNGFAHGSVAKVVYKSDALLEPISTWCLLAFH